jgi:hypothetical protein
LQAYTPRTWALIPFVYWGELCMADEAADDPIAVEVVRDARLKKTIRWEWHGNRVRVRVPPHVGQEQLDRQVADIVAEVKRRRARVRARADTGLDGRARQINERYFGGEVTWHSIRWVTNMEKRLGSCTVSGPTEGDIRISRRIQGWPDWVIDYVIAHELTHLKHRNHSGEFWAHLARYPLAERARGFVQGVAFQEGIDEEGWL